MLATLLREVCLSFSSSLRSHSLPTMTRLSTKTVIPVLILMSRNYLLWSSPVPSPPVRPETRYLLIVRIVEQCWPCVLAILLSLWMPATTHRYGYLWSLVRLEWIHKFSEITSKTYCPSGKIVKERRGTKRMWKKVSNLNTFKIDTKGREEVLL